MIQPMIPNYLRLCLALLALASLSGCATAGGKTAGLGVGKRLTIRTTAYTQTEPGGANNALGTRLHYGGKDRLPMIPAPTGLPTWRMPHSAILASMRARVPPSR